MDSSTGPSRLFSGPGPRSRGGAWLAAASLAFSVGALAVIIRRSGVDAVTALGHLPWQAHFLAMAAFLLELLARGARIVAVARGLGIPLRLRDSVRAQLAGDALGAVSPARVGSDPAKLAVLHRSGVGLGQGGALVLGEMGAESAVLIVAALALAALFPGGWWVALGVGGYAVAVSGAGVVAYFATGWPRGAPPTVWRALRLKPARWHDLLRAAADFRLHAGALRRLPATRAAQALAAAAAHIAAKLAVLPALVALAPAQDGAAGVPMAELVLRPFFTLYATALLPPPGGGGAVEVVFASVLGGILPPATLAAALVWWRVYTFHLGALAGWLFVVASRSPTYRMLDTRPLPEATPSCSASSGGP